MHTAICYKLDPSGVPANQSHIDTECALINADSSLVEVRESSQVFSLPNHVLEQWYTHPLCTSMEVIKYSC